jgi:hypothetical protein
VADLRTLAEAISVLAERRDEDGLAQFLTEGPFPHQVALMGSKKSEAWLFGANRSGKTEAVAAIAAAFLRFGHPDPRPAYMAGGRLVVVDRSVRVWAISLNYDMSRNILQPRLFRNGAGVGNRQPFIPTSELLPSTQGWNITNQTLRLKNGSICIFKTVEAGRDAFQGADIDLAIFDEVPDEEVYTEVSMRVGGGRRLFIRGAATILPPPGVPGGVSWMYERKVHPWIARGTTNDERNAKSPDLDIFTARLRDNPTILADEYQRICAQFAPGSPEYRIRVEGELLPSVGGALVYSNFNPDFHVNAALGPESIDPHLPLCLSVDFNPAGGVWIVGQKQDHVFRVMDEIALERSDIASMAYEFRSRYPAHQAELWIYGDATGRRRHEQTGQSNYHLIQHYLQGYPTPIRFFIPDVNPFIVDRVAAVQLQLRSPDGMRRFEISKTHCPQTINDLLTTKWRAWGKIEKRGRIQSNGADCVGYWIAADAPPARFSHTPTLRSIRGPSYQTRPGVFAPTFSRSPVKVGRQWYTPLRVYE